MVAKKVKISFSRSCKFRFQNHGDAVDFSKRIQDYPLPGAERYSITTEVDDKDVTVSFIEALLVLNKRGGVGHIGKILDIFELTQWTLDAANQMGYEFDSYSAS